VIVMMDIWMDGWMDGWEGGKCGRAVQGNKVQNTTPILTDGKEVGVGVGAARSPNGDTLCM
jgi:hypothetical protein